MIFYIRRQLYCYVSFICSVVGAQISIIIWIEENVCFCIGI
nr:MAG TPA: hypothetical protein [Bacteriophage sp.]